MRIDELMNTQVATAARGDFAGVAANRMRIENVHHLVVMDGRKVAGVVSSHDLDNARPDATLSELMTPNPVSATPSLHLDKAANLLRGRGIGCLPVLDDDKLVGIVTTSDLLELIGRGRGKSDRTATLLNGRRWNNRRMRGAK